MDVLPHYPTQLEALHSHHNLDYGSRLNGHSGSEVGEPLDQNESGYHPQSQ